MFQDRAYQGFQVLLVLNIKFKTVWINFIIYFPQTKIQISTVIW